MFSSKGIKSFSFVQAIIYLTSMLLLVSSHASGIEDEWLNVRKFGAVGNGKVDDTAAFQKALSRGMAILIPPTDGAFLIKRTLIVKPGQTIAGVSRTVSKIRFTSSGPCFSTDTSKPENVNRVTFRDFAIEGIRMPETIGIHLLRSRYSTIMNLQIRDIGGRGIVIDGSAFEGVSQAHYTFIQNVEITGNYRIAIQLIGPKKGEGSNRHRIIGVRANGANDVALEIGPQSGTNVFVGFSAENVNRAMRIAGKNNFFFGTNIENVHEDAIEFLKGAANNTFYGITFGNLRADPWQNPQYNTQIKGKRIYTSVTKHFVF